jgi:hypothetical protein
LNEQCEAIRPVVEKHFGKITDEALFVSGKEAGCVADRISKKNSDGSRDYCAFQINGEPRTTKDLDTCVRRAYEKYAGGRMGANNWSAFYAVCKRVINKDGSEGKPIPKYPDVINNCD